MSKKILLIGEPMGLFIAEQPGKLETVENFILTTCGAEFNVAIGLTRLGSQVTYMTKLGDDPFGKRIINMMNKTGISTEEIIFSDQRFTGFMFKEKAEKGDPGIFYFRKGSAASTLCPADIEAIDFSQYNVVHMTGITPALSVLCRDLTDALKCKARQNGCIFSFDPNLRPQLWKSNREMKDYINHAAENADIFLPGIKEAILLCGKEAPEEIASFYLYRGVKTIIIKLGEKGAYYADCKGERQYVKGYPVDKVIDTVGAGDGFAAGVLSGLQEELSLKDAVRRGCAVGAIQVMSMGDNDGLPYRDELEAFMAGKQDWRRSNV